MSTPNKSPLADDLKKFPKDQQAAIQKKITVAKKYGWSGFFFWDWGQPLHLLDLMGTNSKGEVDFVPDFEDMPDPEES